MTYMIKLIFCIQLLFILNFALHQNLQKTIQQENNQWYGNCLDSSAYQSPINLNGPFSFMTLNLDISFREINSGQHFLQNINNQLIIKGDFGQVSHQRTIFSSYQISFKSPSEHSVGNQNTFFPLEMQVKFVSSDMLKLNMVFLFTYGNESNFLTSLGFGRGVLKNLRLNQSFQIPQAFNLQQILPKKNRFFIYQGSDTISPCEPTIWLIAYDTLKLTQNQLDDFPQALVFQGRALQAQKQEIYINFDIQKQQQEKSEEESSNVQDALPDGKINKIKDSIILLGDDTIYDPFIYGHSQIPSAKLIKDSDYIVLQKDKPADDNQKKMDKQIEDVIFQKQSEEQNQVDELNQGNEDKQTSENSKNKDQSTKENQEESSNENNQQSEEKNENKEENNQQNGENDQKTKENSQQEQDQENKQSSQDQENNQTKEDSLQQKKEDQQDQTTKQEVFLSQKSSAPNNKLQQQSFVQEEHYAFNKEKQWDQIPIFKIDKWPELCSKGMKQSPININTESFLIQEVANNEIQLEYSQLNKNPVLVNDGIKLTLVGQFGSLKYQNVPFFAQFVHIHHPSEHTFESDNMRADIEIQIEHQDFNGNKLVVSLFGNAHEQNHNEFLQTIGIYANKDIQLKEIDNFIKLDNLVFNLETLVNKLDRYYKYEGSLTYPPCSEGVTWILSRDYININQDQIDNFITLIGMQYNVRGTHDLNGRQIFFK